MGLGIQKHFYYTECLNQAHILYVSVGLYQCLGRRFLRFSPHFQWNENKQLPSRRNSVKRRGLHLGLNKRRAVRPCLPGFFRCEKKKNKSTCLYWLEFSAGLNSKSKSVPSVLEGLRRFMFLDAYFNPDTVDTRGFTYLNIWALERWKEERWVRTGTRKEKDGRRGNSHLVEMCPAV